MKKLAIIGASYLQVPLIKKAKELHIETHVFAWEEGAVGKEYADYFYPISIVEKEKILNKCKEIGIDGITSISSDLAMHAVNYVGQKMGLVSNTLECTHYTTSKSAMREIFQSKNINSPSFIKLKNAEIIPNVDHLKFPLIVKPVDRSGSRGVTKIMDVSELDAAIKRAYDESISKEVVIEEFILGQEISIEMISWKGKHHFLASTDKVTTGSPYFVEIEQHQPSHFSEEIINNAVQLVDRALSALGVEFGASHSELLVTAENDIYIVEIGARMGGDNIGSDLVQLSTGFDFVESVINVALYNKPIIEKSIENFSGIYYITPSSGKISDIKIDLDGVESIVKHEIINKQGDNVEFPIKESAHRSAYIMYQSDKKEFYNLDDLIKFEISKK